MARSRNIKPSFFTNEELVEIDPLGRLLFIGLWTVADREGRLEDRPKKIKMSILPCDNCDVDLLLQELADREFLLRYEVNGKKYIQIINFVKHQNPHVKETDSTIPAPEFNSINDEETPDLEPTYIDEASIQNDKAPDLHQTSREKEVASHADSSLPITDSSLPITDTPLLDNNKMSSKHDDIQKIVAYLNERTGSDYRATTKKTSTLIKARLKEGFTYQDFICVIDKKYADWNGTEFQAYLRPETLFGTKFESYLNQKIALSKTPAENPQAAMARRAIEMLNQQEGDGDNES